MFTNAIVRKPCRAMTRGLSSAGLGLPDFALACRQHDAYVSTLERLGLRVSTLDADEAYPDSVFVEDTAVVVPEGAVVANPGAPSRNGEAATMAPELEKRFRTVHRITAPGTLDGGDVMQVERHFYVGLSARTNRVGADQLIDYLGKLGYTGSVADVPGILHLKTGINYLAGGLMLAVPFMARQPAFSAFRVVQVDPAEAYASNSLMINGTVVVPSGFPKTRAAVEAAGYPTVETDTSEFRKLDGGLSCLSLRW